MNVSATIEMSESGRYFVTIGQVGEPNLVVPCDSLAHAEFMVDIWTL